MGVYTRKDSPYYWLYLERPGARGHHEPTRILHDAETTAARQDARRLADQAYRDKMTALARGDLGLTPKVPIAFATYADWYETHATAHKRGARREREILKRLRADFAGLEVAAITRAAVTERRTTRLATVSAGTVNREEDLLKAMLVAAVPVYLAASPIAGLDRVRPPKDRPATETHILTPAAECRLLKALETWPADRALVVLALDTLMRLGDALYLKWTDLRGSYLRVGDPKAGRPYEVPISKRLEAALDQVTKHRSAPWIFWHRRVAEDPRDWSGSVRQMLEYACTRGKVRYGRKVGGITWHSLRHTGASRMIAAGVDPRTVQELGGWSSLRQLTRYTHPTDRARRVAVEAVGRARR